MKYFSPTYWLQAGIAFLALQQAAQGTSNRKLLSKNDFEKLTPHRQREYLQRSEQTIYGNDNPTATSSEISEVINNYNQIAPKYMGAEVSLHREQNSALDKNTKWNINVYKITEDDNERQRGCGSRPNNADLTSQAHGVKCLKQDEGGQITLKGGKKTGYCKRDTKTQVTCVQIMQQSRT